MEGTSPSMILVECDVMYDGFNQVFIIMMIRLILSVAGPFSLSLSLSLFSF